MSRMLNQATLPTWETVTVRISSPSHTIYPETYKHPHTLTLTHTKHKLIFTHTISLNTHTSNHSSNLPLHKSMCNINTHICIQYMATCNFCHLWGTNMDMYNQESCSAGANGRGLKISDGRKCAFTDFPSKLPSLHLHQLNMNKAEPQYWSEPEGF